MTSNGPIFVGLSGAVLLFGGTHYLVQMFRTNTWLGYRGAVRVHRENHPKAFWVNAGFFALGIIGGISLIGWSAILLFGSHP